MGDEDDAHDFGSILDLQQERLERMTRGKANFEKEPAFSKAIPSRLETRLETYRKIYDDFMNDHSKLYALMPPEDRMTGPYFVEFWVDKLETAYVDIVSLILEQKAKLNLPSQPSQNPPSSTQTQHLTTQIGLPTQPLPTFSGNYLEWNSFESFFTNVISRNPNLSDYQRLTFLRGACKGGALSAIEDIPLEEGKYFEAMNILKLKYTNKRAIFEHTFSDFFGQNRISSESASQIEKLVERSNKCVKAFSASGINTENAGPLFVGFVKSLLPSATKAYWEEQLANTSELPSFTQLVNCMEVRIRALKAIGEPIALHNQTSNTQRNNKFTPNLRSDTPSTSSTSSNNNKCPLNCSDAHPIRLCTQFLSMSVEDRIATIERLRYCRNCFAFNHLVSACKSNRNCRDCNARHNSLIHSDVSSRSNRASASQNGNNRSNRAASRPNSSVNCCVSQPIDPRPQNNDISMPQYVPHSCQLDHSALPNQGTQLNCTPIATQINEASTSTQLCNTINTASFRNVLLATAIVNIQAFDGQWHRARALVDQGSETTLITEALTQLLELVKYPSAMSIQGICAPPSKAKASVNVRIKSIYNEHTISSTAVVLPQLNNLLPANNIKIDHWPHIFDLKLADPSFYKPGKIDILLGADIFCQIIQSGLHKGPVGTPIAQQTQLGWILSGGLIANESTVSVCYTSSLDATMKNFFEIESMVDKDIAPPEDKYAIDFFNDTYKRMSDGRFSVRLPFKTPIVNSAVLGRSRSQALAQFMQLERMFIRHPERKDEYVECMNEYIEQNHMQLATNSENNCRHVDENGIESYQSFHFPHHAVIKRSSTSTQVRVVFNASQTTTNGNSLNDILYPGPVLLADLISVMLNWRCHRIVFVADIRQMYRQIVVDQRDISFQRVFWRAKPEEPILEYCMNRLTFGTNFAPFAAIQTLRTLSKLEIDRFPLGAEIIAKDVYMDDVITGGSTIETSLQSQREVIDILKSAGFQLRKWASNSIELLELIPESDREIHTIDHELVVGDQETIKTLGIFWNAASDCFHFKLNTDIEAEKFTKRSTLSSIAKFFDPIGFVAPVITVAKNIMKLIWKEKTGWDNRISNPLIELWKEFLAELQHLPMIRINRFMNISPDDISHELHGFCDASYVAYGAVVYLRVISNDHIISTSLIMAKSKITPMKPVTIPRLELCGAVLLAQLMSYVKKSIRHIKNANVRYWTDSEIVLHWLKNDPNRWQTFVANRVCTILESSSVDQWSHVRTHDNPADLISRGTTPTELNSTSLWWSGPQWLSKPAVQWPLSDQLEVDKSKLEEKRIKLSNHIKVTKFEFLERFSELRCLIRSTAWLNRFLLYARKKSCPTGPLSVIELKSATRFWVRVVQRETFGEEITAVKEKNPSKVKHRLLQLHPFLDSEDIFRVGGRLKRSNLSFDEKHPMILPAKHHLTNLIIDHAHIRTLHGGNQLTSTYIRKKYWILNQRNGIKSRIHRCIKCHRFKKEFHSQLMADLPAQRVQISRAFTHVGVDLCGPFTTRASSGRGIKKNKSYVAVFVCHCVKAIHLELVGDQSTDAFLAAFRRFIARRGLPSNVYSDNGTNFVGAANTIGQRKKELEKFVDDKVIKWLSDDGIQWNFNPPSAPHFGGLFEAGVKSTKHHLNRVLTETSLTFEEFYTVLCQIEACLNSRPLTPHSTDPNDFNVITPGHFLIGDSLLAIPESTVPEDEKVLVSDRYRYMQRIVQSFWKQWNSEYLNRLQNRPKWQTPKENIKENDVVLIKDDRLPPAKWAIGRVIKAFPDSEGLVRFVTVKTAFGTFDRPIVKLSVLPFEPYETIQSTST